MNKYPIFIPSYRRAKTHTTSRILSNFGFKHYLIVHSNEIDDYKRHFTAEQKNCVTVLEFDENYKLRYETCDTIPHRIKNAGSGAERNFAWDYSINLGYDAHWLMDDNIKWFSSIVGVNTGSYFVRRHVKDATTFAEKFKRGEVFFDTFSNLMMIELAESGFTIDKLKNSRNYRVNTRCYSCNLIYNHMPIRWRGRYNEDTILSFDILKAGYCTASYLGGLLKLKVPTRIARGGNHAVSKDDSESIYNDATNYKLSSVDKTKLLLNVYPLYFKPVIRCGRVHHGYEWANIRLLTKNCSLKVGPKHVEASDFDVITHYPIPT